MRKRALTVTFPQVGGVRFTETQGFFQYDDVLPIAYSGKKNLRVAAGENAVVFRKDEAKGFLLDVQKDGKAVLSLDGESILFGLAGNKIKKVKKMMLNIGFEKGEVLYGLGERYNTLNQVGHDALMWNVDTAIHGPNGDNGVDHNESYQCIPVLHSNAGYMLYVNSMYAGWFDFGKKTPYVYSWDFNGPILDVFFFVDTPEKNIDSYTKLTGRPFLPPKWAYQYWMGACWACWKIIGEGHYLEKFQKFVDGYAEMGIHHIAAVYGCEATRVVADGKEVVFTAENGKTKISLPDGFKKLEVF